MDDEAHDRAPVENMLTEEGSDHSVITAHQTDDQQDDPNWQQEPDNNQAFFGLVKERL